MKQLKICFLLLIVVAIFGFIESITPLESYLNKIRLNEVERFPEKTYIHTDKPFYTSKDTIWFKNYLVNGITHKTTTKSNVVYVELINPKDSIVYHQKFYVASNSYGASGDITINPKWESGAYQLRSYTNYMRNQDEGFFFKKSIRIEKEATPTEALSFIDNEKFKVENIPDSKDHNTHFIDNINITFFPEGGNVLANVSNKFGVKATDEKGNGVKVVGVIKEKEQGTEVALFRTFDFGLGYTSFIPKANAQYIAEIKLNGITKSFVLNQAITNGVQLSITQNTENLILKVATNTEKLKGYFLIGHMRGKLFYNKVVSENKMALNYKLITKDLPNGVAHFTLFNAQGKPKSERLVFINNSEKVNKARIIVNKKSFKKRDRVSYNIEVIGKNNEKKNASLSLSVTQKNIVPLNIKENIQSWLLLNSDLRGEVPNSAVFFDPNKSVNQRKYLLESLMLTHGWRRFTWEDYMAKEFKKLDFEPEKGITISGKVLALDAEIYNKQIETTLLLAGKGLWSEKQKVKANQKFEFKNIVVVDSIEAILQAKALGVKEKIEKKIKFVIDDNMKESPKVIPLHTVTSEKENLFLKNYKKVKEYISQVDFTFSGANQLNEVVITGKSKNDNEDYYDEIVSRSSNLEYTFPSDRLILDSLVAVDGLTVFDLLRRVSGVQVIGNDRIRIRGGGIGASGSSDFSNNFDDNSSGGGPLILVDGFEASVDDISFLSSSDIELIDVLKGNDASGFGSKGNNGVIAIYTKTNSGIIINKEREGIVNFTLTPFYKAREFYSKDYFKEENKSSIEPDFKTTLHWNPAANAFKNHVSSNFFYTGDQTGVFQFELEGITEDGELIYQTNEIEVIE